MKVDAQTRGTVTVIRPRGPLTAEERDDFLAAVRAAREATGARLVLDLAGVPYLDSAGIESLRSLCGMEAEPTARPKLASLGDTCREALDLTDVLQELDVFDTVESAIRSYKR